MSENQLPADPGALGCMWMGTKQDETFSFAVLDDWVGRGWSHLDTANCYAWWHGTGENVGGESEALLGRWMKSRGNRNRVFLATKGSARLPNPALARDPSGVANWNEAPRHFEGASAPVLKKALEGSLHRLGTDHIDLYYVHVDDRATPLEETLETLDGFVKQGLVRTLGYSNVTADRMLRIRELCETHGWTLPLVWQMEFSYLTPGEARPRENHATPAWRKALGKDQVLAAYSPILKGLFEGKEKRESVYLWPDFDTPANRRRLETLGRISRETGLDGNALVLAWMVRLHPRVVPVVGFTTEAQYQAAAGALDLPLPPGVFEALDRAFRFQQA